MGKYDKELQRLQEKLDRLRRRSDRRSRGKSKVSSGDARRGNLAHAQDGRSPSSPSSSRRRKSKEGDRYERHGSASTRQSRHLSSSPPSRNNSRQKMSFTTRRVRSPCGSASVDRPQPIYSDSARSCKTQGQDFDTSDQSHSGSVISLLTSPERSFLSGLPTEDNLSNSGHNPALTSDRGEQQNALPDHLLELLGDNPQVKNNNSFVVNPELETRWSYILTNGAKEELVNKYQLLNPIPDNLPLANAPLLNPEVSVTVSRDTLTRDKFKADFQHDLAFALSAIGRLTTCALANDQDLTNKAVTLCSQAGVILANLHYKISKQRRYLAARTFNKSISHLATTTKIDQFLFGSDFGEKIKALKSAERSGQDLARSRVGVSKPLNSYRPSFPQRRENRHQPGQSSQNNLHQTQKRRGQQK